MHADRPSFTAACVAALRALYTEMPAPYGFGGDPLAAALVPAPLALPARAVALAPWASPLVHRALGWVTLGVSFHVPLRTRAIDDALREAIRGGVRQLVILGAGLDNRAMRLDELEDVRVFEVDHPSTQRYKLGRLASLDPPPRARARELVRVPVDFERDRLEDALPAAGFRPDEPSFWIWEGVTVYLTFEAIDATLGTVARLSAPGSRIAVTYSLGSGLDVPAWAMPIAEPAFRIVFGEPIRSQMTTAELEARLSKAGLALISDEGTADWARRYWPGKSERVRSIEHLAIAARER